MLESLELTESWDIVVSTVVVYGGVLQGVSISLPSIAGKIMCSICHWPDQHQLYLLDSDSMVKMSKVSTGDPRKLWLVLKVES